VRRDVFTQAGGFDSQRYREPSIEDIELGMRLAAVGARMKLDPDLQGTHLKHWTVVKMIRTDLHGRGVPWVALLARESAAPTGLNLGWRHRLSAAASIVLVSSLATRRPRRAGLALGALIALNAPFYALLLRRRGPAEAALGVGLHALHHLTGACAVPLGLLAHARERRS
jgi:GT2 family glycosyltransferase